MSLAPGYPSHGHGNWTAFVVCIAGTGVSENAPPYRTHTHTHTPVHEAQGRTALHATNVAAGRPTMVRRHTKHASYSTQTRAHSPDAHLRVPCKAFYIFSKYARFSYANRGVSGAPTGRLHYASRSYRNASRRLKDAMTWKDKGARATPSQGRSLSTSAFAA